jgi:hypothetical protein
MLCKTERNLEVPSLMDCENDGYKAVELIHVSSDCLPATSNNYESLRVVVQIAGHTIVEYQRAVAASVSECGTGGCALHKTDIACPTLLADPMSITRTGTHHWLDLHGSINMVQEVEFVRNNVLPYTAT